MADTRQRDAPLRQFLLGIGVAVAAGTAMGVIGERMKNGSDSHDSAVSVVVELREIRRRLDELEKFRNERVATDAARSSNYQAETELLKEFRVWFDKQKARGSR